MSFLGFSIASGIYKTDGLTQYHLKYLLVFVKHSCFAPNFLTSQGLSEAAHTVAVSGDLRAPWVIEEEQQPWARAQDGLWVVTAQRVRKLDWEYIRKDPTYSPRRTAFLCKWIVLIVFENCMSRALIREDLSGCILNNIGWTKSGLCIATAFVSVTVGNALLL